MVMNSSDNGDKSSAGLINWVAWYRLVSMFMLTTTMGIIAWLGGDIVKKIDALRAAVVIGGERINAIDARLMRAEGEVGEARMRLNMLDSRTTTLEAVTFPPRGRGR